ncbi:hypothetical protein K9L16_00980 [Candidatus Pacearchaeota archaeon]|nr:hypothetical protein [Candidatus Pacearchaeota archaeon]
MKQELLEYGLSEKEVEVYLAGLKAGECTANRFSELTGIRRSTVYEILESLKKKGLILSFKKNNKYFFSSAKPETIISRLKEKQDKIRKILPDLKGLMKSVPEKPGVQLFEGKIGIKNAVEEMLNFKEILIYGASKMGDEIFGHYTEAFARKRVEKKIMMKAVLEKGFSEHMSDKNISKYTKVRVLDFFKNHNSAYFIYGNNLLVISLRNELVAIKIKSPVLVESQKQIFDLMWKIADKS